MLTRLDDYPIHQTPDPVAVPASSDPNVYDRTWFNAYNDDGTAYFGFGTAVYPHREILDAHFSVVTEGGQQHCVYASRRAPAERTDQSVGPVRYEIDEPMRRCRVIIDDNEAGVGCDLTFSARTSPIQEARQILWNRQRRWMDATRYAQFGRWTGTVSTPDGDLEIDSWRGTKDRSWGVRTVGERVPMGAPGPFQPFFFVWAPLQWDDHVSHAVFFDGSRGEPLIREGLTAPLYAAQGDIPESTNESTHMAAALHRLEYHPGTRWVRRGELDLIGLDGATRTIEMTPTLRFQFKGLGYGHPEWKQGMWKGELAVGGESFDPLTLDPLAPENIHVQQVVKVADGERTGIGALEQIVIGPYAPAGFTDLLDGAA